MSKIDAIHIVFENCEVIEVPYNDVSYISMGGISEHIWDNNILHEENFELEFRKSAKYMHLNIIDKPEYNRIKEHFDITHIDFMSGDKSIAYIGLDWHEGSTDYSNLGQLNSYDKGTITVQVEQKDFSAERSKKSE